MTKQLLTVSMPPHTTSPFSTQGIMRDVLIAMLPALVAGSYFFGIRALLVVVTAIASCVLIEHVIQRFMLGKRSSIGDLSAVVTGVLLAFNLPAGIPLWMVVLGSFFAIAVAKLCYGGLGHNPFNPALIGRVFLLSSFPVAMTAWPKPGSMMNMMAVDAVTGATPLGVMKEGLKMGESLPQVMTQIPSYWDLFIGARGGCIGEVSVLALILGLIYLLWRQVISWHIPVIMVVSVFVFSSALAIVAPQSYPPALFHVMTGGVFLGAIFMATDYTTSPMSHKGMMLYACCIGLLTILIRTFGAFPEGVSFAILIMNAFVPLIDKAFKPYRFGEGRK
jgi:Na+-translocating ferredoxin:NAD+ oxidoreductase subunit D